MLRSDSLPSRACNRKSTPARPNGTWRRSGTCCTSPNSSEPCGASSTAAAIAYTLPTSSADGSLTAQFRLRALDLCGQRVAASRHDATPSCSRAERRWIACCVVTCSSHRGQGAAQTIQNAMRCIDCGSYVTQKVRRVADDRAALMRNVLAASLLALTACAGLDTRSQADLIMDRSNPGVRQADQRCKKLQKNLPRARHRLPQRLAGNESHGVLPGLGRRHPTLVSLLAARRANGARCGERVNGATDGLKSRLAVRTCARGSHRRPRGVLACFRKRFRVVTPPAASARPW